MRKGIGVAMPCWNSFGVTEQEMGEIESVLNMLEMGPLSWSHPDNTQKRESLKQKETYLYNKVN